MYRTCDLIEYLVHLYSYNMDITKFFDRNKKELSSNSLVDEVAAKKQHEEILNDFIGLDKDDVSAQGLKSPECVELLFNCSPIYKQKLKM